MALSHSPKIVTDNLVFAYDMDNRKSFKGKPTTNLTTDTPSQNGWQGSYSLIDSATKTFEVTTSLDNAANGDAWRTWYWDVSSFIGSTITLSMDIEFVSETDAEYLYLAIGQGNTGSFPFFIPNGAEGTEKTTYLNKPVEKTHLSWTGVINTTAIVGITQWITNVTVNGGNAVLRISNVQIEESTFETPFVNGTRSNTEAILDQTKNETVTATSLTYNADNTFEFSSASTNQFQITTPDVANGFTVDGWVYPTSTSEARFITPQTNGIDNFIRVIPSASDITLHYCESSDINNRALSYTGSAVAVGQWIYFAASIIDDTAYLWVNGELVNQQTEAFTIGSWAGTWIFGQRGNGTFFLDGKLSNVKIYNRKLSDAEVKQNFNALRGRFGI